MHRTRGCVRPVERPASAALSSIAGDAPLPVAVDHTGRCMAIRDQGASDKCVAFAVAAMKEAQDAPGVHLSVDSIYSLRANAGQPGMRLADGCQIAHQTGVAPNPHNHKLGSFWPVAPDNTYGIKRALAAHGVCVASMRCVPSGEPYAFWRTEDADATGHAVALVGYDDVRRAFKLRNSWGTDYGERGYAWMPYDDMARYGWEVYGATDADGRPNPEEAPPCCACL